MNLQIALESPFLSLAVVFLSHPPLEPCVAAAQTHVCELQQFWVNQEEGN